VVWGYPFAFYRPQIERARSLGVPLVGLNADPDLIHAIAEGGLSELSLAQRKQLPELNLSDTEHRRRFDQLMQGHPEPHGGSLENYYVAQVAWDETMADASEHWLAAHAPMRRLLILAGHAHCQRSAIPRRLERRGADRVAAVWLGTALPAEQERPYFDYAVIVSPNVSR
jgi:uncharacterized iron-regulated protein